MDLGNLKAYMQPKWMCLQAEEENVMWVDHTHLPVVRTQFPKCVEEQGRQWKVVIHVPQVHNKCLVQQNHACLLFLTLPYMKYLFLTLKL